MYIYIRRCDMYPCKFKTVIYVCMKMQMLLLRINKWQRPHSWHPKTTSGVLGISIYKLLVLPTPHHSDYGLQVRRVHTLAVLKSGWVISNVEIWGSNAQPGHAKLLFHKTLRVGRLLIRLALFLLMVPNSNIY